MTTTSPTFTGTYREFHRFIGPYLRNVVQNLTRGPKAKAGACQHCGDASAPLEAAHVHGHDRPSLTRKIVDPAHDDAEVTVDLGEFDAKFKNAHTPIEKSILFLCRPCHSKYDNAPESQVRRGRPSGVSSGSRSGTLPITLTPADPAEFKRALLVRKTAQIEVTYTDGRIETKPWYANRFSESSNVFGNLRSRPEFRAGVWQASGIASLHVRVVDS